ncbi:MAG: DUF928 domain-containing protein [Symploca sp. SIO2G7]|nr:DUF928 domain-containing protein [Symploca sp. SIO2G7]
MIKLLLHKTTLVSALTLVLVSFFSYPKQVQPTQLNSSIIVAPGNKQDDFEPRDRGRRGRRKDGSRRTSKICQALKEQEQPRDDSQEDSSLRLTALVPTARELEGSPESLTEGKEPILSGTLESHPTFSFYIPYHSLDEAQPVKAVLTVQDENRRTEIQHIEVELTKIPGIISIKTEAEEGLEEGKLYYWQFKVNCNPKKPAENPYVEGWIERDSFAALTTEEQQTLAQGTPQQKLDIYLAQSIWHEALELLIEQRRKNPDNFSLNGYWETMMQQDEVLREVAGESFVDCCSASIAEDENPAGDDSI